MEYNFFDLFSLQELATHREILCEISQIGARNSLLLISPLFCREHLDQVLNELKIVLIIKCNEVFLPESLSVHGVPSEAAVLADLSLELINAREALLVLVQEFKQLVKQGCDILVYPVSILKLNNCAEQVDI